VNDQTRVDFASLDKAVIVLIGLCPILLLALFMVIEFYFKRVSRSITVKAVYLVLVGAFVVNGYYSLKMFELG
jgi:hypothetical protein